MNVLNNFYIAKVIFFFSSPLEWRRIPILTCMVFPNQLCNTEEFSVWSGTIFKREHTSLDNLFWNNSPVNKVCIFPGNFLSMTALPFLGLWRLRTVRLGPKVDYLNSSLLAGIPVQFSVIPNKMKKKSGLSRAYQMAF